MKREEEIEIEIEELQIKAKSLSDRGNDIWAQKDRLRNEYKRLTGKYI
jgi:FtsZ-binding cell division protein ZapB